MMIDRKRDDEEAEQSEIDQIVEGPKIIKTGGDARQKRRMSGRTDARIGCFFIGPDPFPSKSIYYNIFCLKTKYRPGAQKKTLKE
ncbi:MAG: hypothetical protein MZU97_13715 [Bacillus subtilis]|nr:hypothetical protein [Bacillus subtilis]